jgi:hypothetical protein
MADTENWAMRIVEGGQLFVRRQPGSRWYINFYERLWTTGNPLCGGALLQCGRLADHYFRGRTFDSPDEAADAVRQLLCAA